MMKTFRLPLMLFAVLVVFASTAVAQDESTKKWHFGIGTGLLRLNAEGDQGLHVKVGDIGPVQAELDLEPDDFDDLIETAFGFGGYVAYEKWLLGYSLGRLKLQAEPSGTLDGGATYASEFTFESTSVEATLGYMAWVHSGGKVAIRPYVGARYIKHELGAALTVTGGSTASAERSVDHNWTDVVIGSSVDVMFTPKWSWGTKFDAGFGGSEGTFRVATGIQWRFWKYMSIGPNARFMAIEYENGTKGEDDDWYLYDVNEFGWGASFLFHF
jgi:hypothetical protein